MSRGRGKGRGGETPGVEESRFWLVRGVSWVVVPRQFALIELDDQLRDLDVCLRAQY